MRYNDNLLTYICNKKATEITTKYIKANKLQREYIITGNMSYLIKVFKTETVNCNCDN